VKNMKVMKVLCEKSLFSKKKLKSISNFHYVTSITIVVMKVFRNLGSYVTLRKFKKAKLGLFLQKQRENSLGFITPKSYETSVNFKMMIWRIEV